MILQNIPFITVVVLIILLFIVSFINMVLMGDGNSLLDQLSELDKDLCNANYELKVSLKVIEELKDSEKEFKENEIQLNKEIEEYKERIDQFERFLKYVKVKNIIEDNESGEQNDD